MSDFQELGLDGAGLEVWFGNGIYAGVGRREQSYIGLLSGVWAEVME